jgi:itaconate CoA-transferase
VIPPADGRAAAPLAGVNVIALEQAVSAPMCSRTLADFRARVVKIEHPDGSYQRGRSSARNLRRN